MQVENTNNIQQIVEEVLDKFNGSSERLHVDLYLYNQLNRHMVKLYRILSSSYGHVVNVALKGYGMSIVVNLVAFAANHTIFPLNTYQGYSNAEWQSDIR
jgi:hypothetical protein